MKCEIPSRIYNVNTHVNRLPRNSPRLGPGTRAIPLFHHGAAFGKAESRIRFVIARRICGNMPIGSSSFVLDVGVPPCIQYFAAPPSESLNCFHKHAFSLAHLLLCSLAQERCCCRSSHVQNALVPQYCLTDGDTDLDLANRMRELLGPGVQHSHS